MVMYFAPKMGFPEMDAAGMLSMMLGVKPAVGWVMHFMIGIIFALSYALFFMNWVRKINSRIIKGTIFGFAVFVFAQIAVSIMGKLFGGMPEMGGNMMIMMIGSLAGHLIYGIIVALFVKSAE
jgi:hypothetical protein